MRAPHALLRLVLGCGLAALTGCKADAARLRWEIAFESTALGARAALVETRIVKGGCDAQEILYVSAFAPDETGTSPPALAKGSYGLIARAQDADCLWYAHGCTDVVLPRSGAPVVVMLGAIDDETLDCDACQAAQCGGVSRPDAAADSGRPMPGQDAGRRDASVEPPDEDAGAPIEPIADAGPPPEPVTISLEPELSPMVQAPFMIVQDDLASGGAYVSYPWDMALTTEENQALKRATPPADDAAGGMALLEFDLPRDDFYRIWGRVITPSLDEDSFWLRIDEGEWIQWNDISHQDQTWHWDDVRPFESRADRFVVPLGVGRHAIRLSYRELGAKLDRLVIASELDWVPVD